MPLFADLFVRDTWADQGNEPVLDAAVSASPDIIPYGEFQLTDAQLISTYNSGVFLDKGVNASRINNIYVRSKNNAPGVTTSQLYLYVATANLLVQPSVWKNNSIQNGNGNKYAQLSATTNGQIVAGDQPFFFTPSPSMGSHFCFLACIQKSGGPSPVPSTDFNNWQGFVDWVRNHANVSWHNVNVVNTLPAEGFRSSLLFNSIAGGFLGFTVTYQNVPVGSQIRIYALPNATVGFPGFDQTITNTQTNGLFGQGQIFPANYSTTIFTVCVFPGVTPPSSVIITTQSLGYVQPSELKDHKRFEPIMIEHKDMPFIIETNEVESGGSFVPISSYTSYIQP